MTDQFAWYRAALAGEKPEVQDGIVESGFFWTKASKAGGRLPVCIWRDAEGAFRCRLGAKSALREIEFDKAAERWPWICSNPVPREEYKVAYETGTWPDGTPTVAPDTATAAASNLPSDPFEALKAQIDDKMASAEAWMKAHPEAKTKTEADYARNLQAELLALNKQADAMHGSEKAPLLAATKACDDKFRFRDAVKTVGSRLKTLFERFAVAEEARLRAAAQAKFDAERRAAEIAQQEVKKQRAKMMDDDPIQALTTPEPELPQLPLAPEPVKINVGGGVGRAAGLKSVWTPTITDRKACLAHYAEHPDVWAAIQKLVAAETRLNKSATSIPGVKVTEERKAA